MQLKDARGPWAGVSPRWACRWPVDGGWRGGRSALPFIRETQIEAAAGCHLAPVRMAIVTKPASNGCRRGRGAGGHRSGQPLWQTVWRLLGKLKTEPPCAPAVALLGI